MSKTTDTAALDAALARVRALDLAQAPGSETYLLGHAVNNLSELTIREYGDELPRAIARELEWWEAAYEAQAAGVDADLILDGPSIEDLARYTREALKAERYPTEVAREASLRRPDLTGIDAVLTADPTLTVEEVIEVLDRSAADYRAEG